MTRFHRYKIIPAVFFPLMCAGAAAAASPDPRLLSMVPPGAQIVAGISAPPAKGQPDNFVLMTHNNTVDLEDFFALTGADSTRIIQQIVFVAMAAEGRLTEHSLLTSGHFDQAHIFQSAVGGGAALIHYQSISVLEIQPFARERNVFLDVRWLAVLDSSILVFGSIASTRLELDRYLAHSQIDASLLRRLSRLRSKDQTWCLLSTPAQTLSTPVWIQEIDGVLANVNPQLAELSRFADEIEFGLHYGRQVQFEYRVELGSPQETRSIRVPILRSSPSPPSSAFLLPNMNLAEEAGAVQGLIEIPISQYKEWLAQIRRPRVLMR